MKTLTPIILILIAIAVFFFLIDPKYTDVQALQMEVAENEKTLKVAQELAQKRQELRDKYNSISQEEKNKIERLLPDTVDNVRLIIYIDDIAEKMGLVVRNISIASEKEPSPNVVSGTVESQFEGIVDEDAIQYVDTTKIGVISFSFSVAAEYDVFLDFLTQLEDSLRIVDIRNINITRGSADSGLYEYSVTLDTYWLK